MKLEEVYRIKGEIECVTGLHIGGTSEILGIGGVDAPVIIDRSTNLPVIPGSSLKGKMRALLEMSHEEWLTISDKKEPGRVHNCNNNDCNLCVVFGRGASEGVDAGPTRLIVRDAFPTEGTREFWKKNKELLHGTEIKGENFLNRITSMPKLRFIERVVAGSKFDLEMIYLVFDEKDRKDRLKMVFEAMALLEDTYLGRSGTRGYGKIRFANISIKKKEREDYKKGNDWRSCPERIPEGLSVREILAIL